MTLHNFIILSMSIIMLISFLYMISITILDFFKKIWFPDNINIDEITKLQQLKMQKNV
jgi:hypothetical protein